jgi:hypothetical protein
MRLRAATIDDLAEVLDWIVTAEQLCFRGGPQLSFPPTPVADLARDQGRQRRDLCLGWR